MTIVGHLAPDLDCLTAIWILIRFGGAANAALEFVPAGETFEQRQVDIDPRIVHVDTGGGRYDHHQRKAQNLCAAGVQPSPTARANGAAKISIVINMPWIDAPSIPELRAESMAAVLLQ